MLITNTLVLVITIGLASFMSIAHSVETLSAEELSSHCTHYSEDPTGQDATFCIRYIQGFIDGAVATDVRVTENVAQEYDTSNIQQRAMRTRIGSRLKRYGPSYYAEFCLIEPISLQLIVEQVTADLLKRKRIDERLSARSAVYQTLREQFPCDK